jgi:hypothetical protein
MTAVAWVFGLFGLVSLLLAISRLAAARRLAAAGHAALAALLIGAAVVTGVLAADLASYQPREGDRPIAELYLEQVGTRRYRATLTRLPGGRMQVFELAGDAWRVDARTLDFGGWARAIGGRPEYRLERLVAIERATTDATPSPTGGFALDPRDGFDLWQSSRHSGRWGELVRAGDARSDELPMSGKSRFELRLDGQRIDVRASSDVAEDRVAAETAAPAP